MSRRLAVAAALLMLVAVVAASSGQAQEQPLRAAGVTPSDWIPLGPSTFGGALSAVSIHPVNHNDILVGSPSGGIWRSTNGGASWTPVADNLLNLAISDLARSSTQPDVIYAGTGGGPFLLAVRGGGIHKSVDGGATWQTLPSTSVSPTAGITAADFYQVQRVAVSPDGTVLLAGTETGVFRSLDGGQSFQKATTTAGLPVNVMPGISDLDFHPTDSRQVVAASFNGRIWHSADGGATWELSTGLPTSTATRRGLELAFAPSDPSIVYAAAQNGRMFRSTNSGVHFTLLANQFAPDQENRFSRLWISPTNSADILWSGHGTLRSDNGGLSFGTASFGTYFPDDYTRSVTVPSGVSAIVPHPSFDGTSNRTVFFATSAGLYRSGDFETLAVCFEPPCDPNLQPLNSGLSITQNNDASPQPSSGRVVVAAAHQALIYDPQRAPGSNWTSIYPIDALRAFWDPLDSTGIFLTSFFPGFGLSLSRYVATIQDDGSPFVDFRGDLSDFIEFASPFTLDPSDPHRMLLAGYSVWETRNPRAPEPHWEQLSPYIYSFGAATAIAIAPSNSDVTWVGYYDGRVRMTTNGRAGSQRVAWQDVDDNAAHDPFPFRRIERIVIDPANENIVYVAVGSYFEYGGGNNLFRSVNGAAGPWIDISGSGASGLPELPVRTVALHPTQRGWIYAATEAGVYASTTGGTTWSFVGPLHVSVRQLFFLNGELYASTWGRGLWKTAVAVPPNTPSGLVATVSGAQVTLAWSAASSGPAVQRYVLRARAARGGAVLLTHRVSAATTSLTTDLPDGVFYVTVAAENAEGESPESEAIAIAGGNAALLPGPPRDLSATAGVNTFTLRWRAPEYGAAPAYYRLDAAAAPGATDISVVLPATAIEYSPPMSIPNGRYYLRLTAVGANGDGPVSNEISLTVGRPPQLTVSRSGNAVTLAWTADATGGAPTRFAVQVGSASGLTNLGEFATTATSLTTSGVPAGTYFVRVIAFYAGGLSLVSNELQVVIP